MIYIWFSKVNTIVRWGNLQLLITRNFPITPLSIYDTQCCDSLILTCPNCWWFGCSSFNVFLCSGPVRWSLFGSGQEALPWVHWSFSFHSILLFCPSCYFSHLFFVSNFFTHCDGINDHVGSPVFISSSWILMLTWVIPICYLLFVSSDISCMWLYTVPLL